MVLLLGMEVHIENCFLSNFKDTFQSSFASNAAGAKARVRLILFSLLGYTFHLLCGA